MDDLINRVLGSHRLIRAAHRASGVGFWVFALWAGAAADDLDAKLTEVVTLAVIAVIHAGIWMLSYEEDVDD